MTKQIKDFNQDDYKRTGWQVIISELDFDNYQPRLIIRVATGRKYWPFFSEIINLQLGEQDPAIQILRNSLPKYTFPMIDRFVSELEAMLLDLYGLEIKLK